MNKLILTGNLTRDPEMRETQNGTKVCTFTLAVNRRSQSEHPEADYFRVTAWRGLAESCSRYLKKGRKCCVVGAVGASAYVGNDGRPRASLEVVADEVEFLSPRPQEAAPDGYVPVSNEELPEFD